MAEITGEALAGATAAPAAKVKGAATAAPAAAEEEAAPEEVRTCLAFVMSSF